MKVLVAAILATTFAFQAEAGTYPRYRCPGAAIPCIVMVGDSTVWCNTFYAPGEAVNFQAASCTSKVLQEILRMQPKGYLKRLGGKDLRKAIVLNLAVGGTNTRDWARTPWESHSIGGQRLCDRVFTATELYGNPGLQLVRRACEEIEGGGMASKIPALTGRAPDVILMTIGTNNYGGITAEQTLMDIVAIRNQVAPSRILISSPFRTENIPGRPSMDGRQAFHDTLTGGLEFFGMLTGPNFGLYPLRTWDGLHLREPGYATAAGLWLESLYNLPR